MAKATNNPHERFKRWHWGIDPTHEIDVDDDRYPETMIEIGRLMELRVERPLEGGRSNPKSENIQLEVEEDQINKNYVVFDHDHDKDRIYFILSSAVQKDLKSIYKDLDDEPVSLEDLADDVGGHHGSSRKSKNDYPDVMVKPIGYLTDLGYYTHKKGDDDGIGSAYIHKMGEEKGGVEPILALSEDGHLWLVGGSYTCPYAGITN